MQESGPQTASPASLLTPVGGRAQLRPCCSLRRFHARLCALLWAASCTVGVCSCRLQLLQTAADVRAALVQHCARCLPAPVCLSSSACDSFLPIHWRPLKRVRLCESYAKTPRPTYCSTILLSLSLSLSLSMGQQQSSATTTTQCVSPLAYWLSVHSARPTRRTLGRPPEPHSCNRLPSDNFFTPTSKTHTPWPGGNPRA